MPIAIAELDKQAADLARMREIEIQNEELLPQVKQWIMEVLRENDEFFFELYELADIINRRYDVPLWQNWENLLIRETGHSAAHANPVDLRLKCTKKALLALVAEGKIESRYFVGARDNFHGNAYRVPHKCGTIALPKESGR